MDDPPMSVVITTSEVPLDAVRAPSVSIMPSGLERAGMSIEYYPGSGITR